MPSTEEDELRRIVANLRPAGVGSGPQRISEILSRLMTRRGYGNLQNQYEWAEVWEKAAGAQANQARPGKLNRGVLEVIVRNSAILQELTFRKKQLLRAIQEQVPQFKVKDLRFRVGEIG